MKLCPSESTCSVADSPSAKCLAEDAQHIGVRVQRAVDDGHDETLGVVLDERLFDDALACAWVSDDDAEAALLAVHTQCVEHLLLLREQCDGVVREGVLIEPEVRADHRDPSSSSSGRLWSVGSS